MVIKASYFKAEDFLPVEPRIYSIKKELEQLSGLIDFEFEGNKVEVNGFRLRNLENWKTYKSSSALDALTPLSGACNCNCIFCFERKHPFTQNHSVMSLQEAETRLKYYSSNGTSLFPSDRVFKETFVNPYAIRILKLARKKDPNQIFHLTSNGTLLTREIICDLSKLKPLMLIVSVNCIEKETREALMGPNNNSELVLDALNWLKEYKIPFIGSIVAWPRLSDEELIKTVHYIDQYDPYTIRIRLPIYHSFLHKTQPFDTERYWSNIKQIINTLSPKVTAPLIVEPALYWSKSVIPEIDGIINNSPAFKSGLQRGDLIQFINNEKVYSRTHAISKLSLLKSQGKQTVRLKIKRGQNTLNVLLKGLSINQDQNFPYSSCSGLSGENFGIFLIEDFRFSYINNLIKIIDNYGAQDILLFSSPPVQQIFESIIEIIPEYSSYFQEKRLRVVTLEHTILGGNCILLDGKFTDDFIAQINIIKSRDLFVPDLILIPAAFGSEWGFDLLRKSYKQIERLFDIPVEIIPWSIIYGREV